LSTATLEIKEIVDVNVDYTIDTIPISMRHIFEFSTETTNNYCCLCVTGISEGMERLESVHGGKERFC